MNTNVSYEHLNFSHVNYSNYSGSKKPKAEMLTVVARVTMVQAAVSGVSSQMPGIITFEDDDHVI